LLQLLHLVADAQHVLDVVPDLMGQDVGRAKFLGAKRD
jgi:hypothetical protein